MDPQLISSGIAHVWTQCDAVIRTVALVLLAMSLATWIIILWKALDRRAHRCQARTCEGFWHSTDFSWACSAPSVASTTPRSASARRVWWAKPQPELHTRGDRAVRYERVAQALVTAQRVGVQKIGFVTEPQTP